MIRRSHSEMSITKQCKALGVNRSSWYYQARAESPLNLELMDLMDAHYLAHPYKGARRMWVWLRKDMGYEVSRNRIERLYYQVMGLRAIIPGPHTSKRSKDHKVYPYLLRDYELTGPNEVWATDITYVAVERGFMYLTAIIDLYSRYVVNWSLSNTMEANWCASTLQEAIEEHGCPKIINTDQGAQYTSEVFTTFVGQKPNLRLSMDGKGRATDNAFIERLWRSVKYEKLHLYKPRDGQDLYMMLAEYFDYYNHQRRHSMIDDQVPASLFSAHIRGAKAVLSLPHYHTLENVILPKGNHLECGNMENSTTLL